MTGPPWLHLHRFCGDSTNPAVKKAWQRSLRLHVSDPPTTLKLGKGEAAEWGEGWAWRKWAF